jgi:hypothetical protein
MRRRDAQGSARMSAKCWITSPVASRSSGTSGRRFPAGSASAWCSGRCRPCRSSAAGQALGCSRTSSSHIGLSAYLFSPKISLPNDPGRTFAVLLRRKNALGDETADGGLAEGENCGRLFDCRLAAVGVLAVTIDGDVVLMAQGANTSPCPTVAATGRFAGSIEQRRDRLVGHLARQSANQINHLHVGGPSRLTGAVALRGQAGVVAALPVDDQLQGVADDVDDDL